MKRFLLVLLILFLGMQLHLAAQSKAENMRMFGNDKISTQNQKHEHKRWSRYMRGEYLICILAIGTYVVIKRRKSRRIDL